MVYKPHRAVLRVLCTVLVRLSDGRTFVYAWLEDGQVEWVMVGGGQGKEPLCCLSSGVESRSAGVQVPFRVVISSLIPFPPFRFPLAPFPPSLLHRSLSRPFIITSPLGVGSLNRVLPHQGSVSHESSSTRNGSASS